MVIIVKLIGVFRSVSGKEELTLKTEGSLPLREAMRTAVAELPKLERMLMDLELGDPRPNALILVNGKEISVLDGLQTMVKDGDEVILIPVVHGG